ncbi:aldo/keto reductase [Meredithblackwellia eburnea MCA 4105]
MTVPTAKLNNGLDIPVIGLGCWMGKPGKEGENQEAYQMVVDALKAGYTHFDTASGYGNEEAVGRAIRESGISREKLFVTTKLKGPDHGRVAEALEESLKLLNIGYLDLFLVHWPQATDPETKKVLKPDQSPTVNDTWADMEKLLDTGKVKSIGVSNFSIQTLERLLPTVKIVPSVNQVESHPYFPQRALTDYCKEKGIHLTAYCPLGQYNSPILKDDVILKLAEKYNKTTGQVLLNWSIQRGGWSVVPKSSNPTRMAQNLVTFTLEDDEIEAISNLHKTEGKYKSLCSYPRSDEDKRDGKLFGWTLEEMGWNKAAFP